MDDSQLEQAASWLRKAQRVVAFTGAGVSQESGIPTFRDGGGLWSEFDPETFATPSGLIGVAATQPSELARFLHDVLAPIADASPNPAHIALASLHERHRPVVITQNVDGLHQEAGSERVFEIHGSLLTIVGSDGERLRVITRKQLKGIVAKLGNARRGPFRRTRVLRAVSPVFGFGEGFVHRPSIVLFGEALAEPDWRRAQEEAARCDLVISIGTSGDVWPANKIPGDAARRGVKIIGVGPEELDADLWLRGRAGEVIPALIEAAGAST